MIARNWQRMGVAAFMFVIAGCVTPPPAEIASADTMESDPALLYVVDDESSAELMIDDYLRRNEGLAIAILEYDELPDDLYLRFDVDYARISHMSLPTDAI